MSNKTQSLEERFNEIHAVASASLLVEKLRELSKSPKLARTREQRAHEWIVLSRLSESQANALRDLAGPNPVLKRLAPPVAFDSTPNSQQAAVLLHHMVKEIEGSDETSS